ncbi:hypothetical protein BGZ88_004568 [Linnemannia elongata]|nr:hypothetical protein BGZ88_004568 [Linnemannia elongata]
MGYEYILLAAAIIVPLGIFSVFKGDLRGAAQVLNEKRSSLPGAFGNDSTSTKSKKKKNKKKNKSSTTATTGAAAALADDNDDESSDSEVEEKKPMTRQNKKSINNKGNSTSAPVASSAKKANNNNNSSKGSNATVPSSSPSSTSIPSTNNSNKSTSGNNQESAKAKAFNNNTTSKQTPSVSTPTVTTPSSTAASNKATSVEDWKKQRQAEQKEILIKQQEALQFSSAASKNTSSFSSSPNVTSIPGPGAMGNNKKKNRGQAGAGLSHAEFPTLSRPQPAPAPAPKQPKQKKEKKEKKDKEAVKPEPVSESKPEPVPVQESEEESDEDNDRDQQLRDDQLLAQQLAWSEGEGEQEEKEEEDEWTTVSGNGAAPVRSGGIDFNRPMDPWVAQRQRQLQDEIAAVDPHGEQTTQFARVLSIKPAAKEERFREAIPDGFSVQKTRSGTSTGSSSYQSAEMTKKQRENLAKAAKRKEDKAAADALQEKRKQEHMRQVKAEKMKEFYRSQSRKSTPVESRWDVPKSSDVSSSTVSGGMSAQVNDKGQLIWD